MRKPHYLRRLLAGLTICSAFALEFPAAAVAETVTYLCVPYRPGTFGPHPAFTVTVNYSDKTARNVFSTSTVWLPAEISDATIKWTNVIRYPDGNTLKDHWSVDRNSGLLTRADAGTAHCVQSAQMVKLATGRAAAQTQGKRF